MTRAYPNAKNVQELALCISERQEYPRNHRDMHKHIFVHTIFGYVSNLEEDIPTGSSAI